MFAMLVLSVSGVIVCIIVSVCFSMCAFFFFLTAAASVFFPPSVKGLENRYKIEAESTLGWEGLGWVQRSNTFLSLFLCPNLTSTSTHTHKLENPPPGLSVPLKHLSIDICLEPGSLSPPTLSLCRLKFMNCYVTLIFNHCTRLTYLDLKKIDAIFYFS